MDLFAVVAVWRFYQSAGPVALCWHRRCLVSDAHSSIWDRSAPQTVSCRDIAVAGNCRRGAI